MNTNPWIRRFLVGGLTLLLAALLTAWALDSGHKEEYEGHDHETGQETHAGEETGDGEHASLDEHEKEGSVHLDAETREEFGVTLAEAGPCSLHREVVLTGEVRLDQDRIAHVTPTVPGNVHQMLVREGDHVQRGQVLAVIHSEELATAISDYLEAREQLLLARATHQRVQTLQEEGIAAEEELQVTQRDLQAAEIGLRSSKQTLHALGASDERIERIGDDPSVELSHHELIAPLTGQVIQRTIVQGEWVTEETDAFIVADLNTVWVDANVYPRDLGVIREGMRVKVVSGYGIPEVSGKIEYIGPVVGEETRTAIARTEVTNPDGLLRPGLFVNVHVATASRPVEVAVPRSAVISMNDQPVVFVETDEGLTPRPVRLGRKTEQRVEVLAGLQPGERYAVTGVLTLKAQMNSAALESAGHTH